jgi:molybdenum cofactor cytidylyltransferase
MIMGGTKAVDCVLLAAGASVRMGEPKLMLPLGEKTIFEVVLASHLASSLRRICAVVPGWLPGFREVARRQGTGRLDLVELDVPGAMSESLKAGWQRVERAWKPDGVMISLADKPLVAAKTIDHLIECFAGGDHEICVPVYAGKWGHPVILSSRLGPEIMALQGDRGAIDVLTADRTRVDEVEVESDGIIIDVDTAGDVEELRTRLGLNG